MPEAEQVTFAQELFFKSTVGLLRVGFDDGGLPSGFP